MSNLSNVIKNSEDYKNFVNAFNVGQAKHAYIVMNQDTVLREAFIKELASFILQNSALVEANSHPDLNLVTGNEKGNILVEDVLVAIDKIQFKASLGQYKVLIIMAKTNLSERVQNKLLKTLEEPPKDTIIFLSVASFTGVLPTILSRAEKLVLNNLSTDVLLELGFSKQIIDKSENMLYLCNKLMHDKLKFSFVEECLSNMKNSSQVILFSRKISKSKEEAKEYLFYFGHIFNLLIKDNLKSSDRIYSAELIEDFPLMVLSECIVALNKANLEVDANCSLGQVIDKFLLKILEVKYLCRNNI